MYIVVFVLKRPFFVKLIYSCTFLYIVNSIDILLRKLMHIYVGLSRSSFVLEVTTITLVSYRDCDNQMGIHENWNEKIKFFMNPKFCTSFWFSDKFNFVVWFWKKNVFYPVLHYTLCITCTIICFWQLSIPYDWKRFLSNEMYSTSSDGCVWTFSQ